MEGGNTDNSNFISDCMKDMMYELDTRKKLFDLIKFDGTKVVQVAGELLEVKRPNLTCILLTLHGGNTCFRDIVNLEFLKNLIRGSKPVH